MSYWNPILAHGPEAFARDLAAAGGAGVITPDLIPDEGQEWIEASERHGVDRVFLVAPSSPATASSMWSRTHADSSTRPAPWGSPAPARASPPPRRAWSSAPVRPGRST